MGFIPDKVELFGKELSATMTGSAVLIGILPQTPVKIIFDNQGSAPVAIYVNQTSTIWRTFPAGEALVLDCTGFYTEGTSFYGIGASGTFSISYTYLQNL